MLEITWLLTTIAQSTAALVAIIGGLLVSRYVSLHAQQKAAGRRVSDLSRRQEAASESFQAARESLEAFGIEVLSHDPGIYQRLLRLPAEIGPEDIPEDLLQVTTLADEMDRDRFRQRLVELRAELARSREQIALRLPDGGDRHRWHEISGQLDFPQREEHLWAWSYRLLCRERDLSRPADATSLPAPSRLDGNDDAETQWDIAEHQVLQRRVERLGSESRSLRQELQLARETLEASRQPEGFRLALLVLSTAVAFGIAVPGTALAFWPAQAPWGAELALRVLCLGLFLASLGVILRFLFHYAAFLRGDEPQLPERLWHLARRRSAWRSSLAPGDRLPIETPR